MSSKRGKGVNKAAGGAKPSLNRESFSRRQLIFWTSFFLGLILAVFVSASFSSAFIKWGVKASIAIQIVIQDALVFILPAYIAARFATSRPMRFVMADKAPSWRAVVFTVLLLLLVTPGLNYIVYLNESLTLPESMSALEQWMRVTEENARAVTDTLLDNNTLAAMAGCVLLVGLLTGFSEELFFRGALQGIFNAHRVNVHVSIWFVALVFSVLHFQFFGFVPRLLLGAMFGYLVYWSRSLWTSVIAHTLNNSVVVVSTYLISCGCLSTDIDSIGVPADGEFPALAVISLILTGFLISRRRYFFPQVG